MSDYNFDETLRVLLVSAAQESYEAVGQVLGEGKQAPRFYWVSEPELAPLRVQEVAPHVILIDALLNGADALALISAIQSRAPSALLLALIDEGDMNQARQAMLAGARGFVTKPIRADEFQATVRQLLRRRRDPVEEAPRREQKRGEVIVFCAPKGGTGRTTLAINSAISLQRVSSQAVALIDADYASPAVDVALNLRSERTIVDLLPRLSRLDEELLSSVLVPHVSGLRVLLAPPPADLSAPISLPQAQQVLVTMKRMFRWVIVDLGLPLDETAFAFLDTADRIVLSVLPEMVGLRNTRLMLDQLVERGYAEDRVWLVLNRATLPGGVSVRDIEQRLGVTIHDRIPDDQPLATLSVNRGVPVVMSHERSALGRAFRGFASRIARAHEEPASTLLNGHGQRGGMTNVPDIDVGGFIGNIVAQLRGKRDES